MKGIKLTNIPFNEYGTNVANVAIENGIIDEAFCEETENGSYGTVNGEYYLMPAEECSEEKWLQELVNVLTWKGSNPDSMCNNTLTVETLMPLIEDIEPDEEDWDDD